MIFTVDETFWKKPESNRSAGVMKRGVGSFGCGEQLLLAKRKLVRVSSSVVSAVDALFDFLWITGSYHQNAFIHT